MEGRSFMVDAIAYEESLQSRETVPLRTNGESERSSN